MLRHVLSDMENSFAVASSLAVLRRERERANEGVPATWASLRSAVHEHTAGDVDVCVCGGGTAGPGGGPGPGGVDCAECGSFRLDLSESQRAAGMGHGKFRFFTQHGEHAEHV